MKSIYQNADHKAATVQLNELTQAHNAAKLEESALLVQLNDSAPPVQHSALDRAKAMLTGQQAPARQDLNGLNIRLGAVRENLALLGEAIGEQRGIMAGLMQAQSAVINADAKQGHIKAAQGIKSALAGLRDAMQAEQSIRAEIAAGGYQCSLEPLERPELSFADSQSTVNRFVTDVNAYLTLHELRETKAVNIRLLCEKGDGLPGDVLTMTGIEAAALVRIGHGEQTGDKPSRVARPVRESYGVALG